MSSIAHGSYSMRAYLNSDSFLGQIEGSGLCPGWRSQDTVP